MKVKDQVCSIQQIFQITLLQLKLLLNRLLQEPCFQLITSKTKPICYKLNYFLSLISCHLINLQPIKSILASCFVILKGILHTLQYESKGHILPIIFFLCNFCQRLTKTKIQQMSPQILLKRADINEVSDYYLAIELGKISKQEINFLKFKNVNNFVKLVQNNQIILQNPECLCCSQVYIKNWKVTNKNPLVNQTIYFPNKKGIDFISLERNINAVCNNGGGVILIGAERKQKNIRIGGINFNSQEEIEEKQRNIQKALECCFPEFNKTMQRVLVHTNYLTEENVQEEYLRICFRISIFPRTPRVVYYLKHQIKGREICYQLFKLDEYEKLQKIVATNSKNEKLATYYDFIHRKYRSKKPQINSHKNMICLKPVYLYSKRFLDQIKNGLPLIKQQENIVKKQESQCFFDDEPKFKYPRTTLLITNTIKNDRYILDLQSVLKNKKKIFELGKPFENSFKSGQKSIWMISHDLSIKQLKGLVRDMEKDDLMSAGTIKIYPVCSCIKLEGQKFNKYYEKMFRERFESRYSQEYEISVSKEATAEALLVFNDHGQAIYAYMILQQLQLRPNFFQKQALNQ